MCSKTLPAYPASMPVQERDTFWRWQKDESHHDLMIASQSTILNSLLFAVGGTPRSDDVVDPQKCGELAKEMRHILGVNFSKSVTLNEPVNQEEYRLTQSWLKLLRDAATVWPEGCARPVNLEDYR